MKRIVVISLIVLVIGSMVLIPLLKTDTTTNEVNAPGAVFLFKENLAVNYASNVNISLKVLADDITKMEVIIQDSSYKVWTNPKGILKFNLTTEKLLVGTKEIRLLAYKGNQLLSEDARLIRVLSNEKPLLLTANVLGTSPHNPSHFTQGLEFNNNVLYESTGQNGESKVAKINLATGEPSLKIGLDANYFGEGITVFKNLVYQLTWQQQKCFVYDKESLVLQKDIPYTGEGWGLCNDGTNLIMSDGSERLYFRDPNTFQIKKIIEVYDQFGPKIKLNELEYINGKIYANVWMEDQLLVIDPATGKVNAIVDCKEVIAQGRGTGEVLNGIAYNPTTKKTYLTGKNWSKIVEVSIK